MIILAIQSVFADDYAIYWIIWEIVTTEILQVLHIFSVHHYQILSHIQTINLMFSLNSNVYFSINAEYVSNYQWQHSTDKWYQFY